MYQIQKKKQIHPQKHILYAQNRIDIRRHSKNHESESKGSQSIFNTRPALRLFTNTSGSGNEKTMRFQFIGMKRNENITIKNNVLRPHGHAGQFSKVNRTHTYQLRKNFCVNS